MKGNLWCGSAFRNSCSLSTFQRSAFRLGFKSHPPITNILLTKEYRRKRREWAQKHQNVDWSRVIFSDESRFIINYDDGRIKVHRLKHERFLKSCMLEFNKGRQPSVMLDAMFQKGQLIGLMVTELFCCHGQPNLQTCHL